MWYMIPINQCERLWSVHPALRKPHCWGKKCPRVFELIVPLDQSLTFLLSLYFSQEKVSKIKTISTHYQPGSVLSMFLKCWSISASTFLWKMVLLKKQTNKKQKQTTKNTWKRVPQHGERSRMYVGASTKVPKYFERSQSATMFERT